MGTTLIKTESPEETILGTFLQKGRSPKSAPTDGGFHILKGLRVHLSSKEGVESEEKPENKKPTCALESFGLKCFLKNYSKKMYWVVI